MTRIRTVKPEFFRHEELYIAEKESGLPLRLAFEGLWLVADREGRFRWKPREIKLDVLPYDEIDFSLVLESLKERNFIIQYEVEGELYGFIPSFLDHQRPNAREGASRLPSPPLAYARTCTHVQDHGELELELELELGLERELRESQETLARIETQEPNPEPTPGQAPTLADVSAYCAERRSPVDPGRFLDYYASRGWTLNGAPVLDWRALVRTWESRETRPAEGALAGRAEAWGEEEIEKHLAALEAKAAGPPPEVDFVAMAGDSPLGRALKGRKREAVR